MAQAQLPPLPRVEVVDLFPLERKRCQQIFLAVLAQVPDQSFVDVEMVLDRRLAGPGDEHQPPDAGQHQLFGHVLHDRLLPHGQHFLGLALGQRQQTSAPSRHRHHRHVDRHARLLWARIRRCNARHVFGKMARVRTADQPSGTKKTAGPIARPAVRRRLKPDRSANNSARWNHLAGIQEGGGINDGSRRHRGVFVAAGLRLVPPLPALLPPLPAQGSRSSQPGSRSNPCRRSRPCHAASGCS